jgi:hypothetical protein
MHKITNMPYADILNLLILFLDYESEGLRRVFTCFGNAGLGGIEIRPP